MMSDEKRDGWDAMRVDIYARQTETFTLDEIQFAVKRLQDVFPLLPAGDYPAWERAFWTQLHAKHMATQAAAAGASAELESLRRGYIHVSSVRDRLLDTVDALRLKIRRAREVLLRFDNLKEPGVFCAGCDLDGKTPATAPEEWHDEDCSAARAFLRETEISGGVPCAL